MTPIEVDPAKGLNGAIAGELRAERGRAQMTFDALAERTHVSRRTLIRLLNGERPISMATLEAICEAFDVLPSDVLASAQDRLAREARFQVVRHPASMSHAEDTIAASDYDHSNDVEGMEEAP